MAKIYFREFDIPGGVANHGYLEFEDDLGQNSVDWHGFGTDSNGKIYALGGPEDIRASLEIHNSTNRPGLDYDGDEGIVLFEGDDSDLAFAQAVLEEYQKFLYANREMTPYAPQWPDILASDEFHNSNGAVMGMVAALEAAGFEVDREALEDFTDGVFAGYPGKDIDVNRGLVWEPNIDENGDIVGSKISGTVEAGPKVVYGTQGQDVFQTTGVEAHGGDGNDTYIFDSNSGTVNKIVEESGGGSDRVVLSGFTASDVSAGRIYLVEVDGKVYLIVKDGSGNTIVAAEVAGELEALQLDDTILSWGEIPTSTIDDFQNVRLPEDEEAEGDDSDSEDTDTYGDEVSDEFGDSEQRGSPLVLDLDGDGVELSSLNSTAAVYWDIDQDGFAEASGWVSADDGLLAIDWNSDGVINDNGELFGSLSTDGFTQLSSLDGNLDGIIDASDVFFGDLLVWKDSDQDGTSDLGEIYSLADLDIVSISLSASSVSYSISGNLVSHESTFTVDDGVNSAYQNDIVDAWFSYSDLNSVYDGHFVLDYLMSELDVNLRGYGELADLQVALSLDNDRTDGDSLISIVSGVAGMSFADVFDETNGLTDDVHDFMYRWAGVDDVSALSRGTNIDARKVEFLEKFVGIDFVQSSSAYQTDPGPDAAEDLENAFHIAFNNIYARLLLQSAGGELFDGSLSYDISSDSFSGITGLNSAKISALESEATSLSSTGDREIFWQNVVRMVEFSVGTSNLPSGDQTDLVDAITNSDASLSLSGIISSLDYAEPIGTTYNGTSGNDTLTTDTADNDTFNGQAGDDTITASDGNDELNGGAGDDVLTGGIGNDYLLGGTGDDEYHWDAGDGHDIIKEDGTGTGNDDDRIVLGTGFDSSDLTITRLTNTGLLIELDNGTDTGSFLIEDQFNVGNGHVELIEFSDSSTYRLDDKNYTLTGTAGADELYGVEEGGADADTIYGGAGNDEIYGYAPNQNNDTATNNLYGEAGNDEIYGGTGTDNMYGGADDDYLDGNGGDDVLDGGTGDDYARGDGGDDEYVYTGGHDTYFDNSGSADKITLDAAYDSVTPDYYRFDDDLQIYWDADNTITISNFYNGDYIETMVYDDTTTVTLTSVSAITQGTSAGETLSGTSGDDLLYGNGGDDTVNGFGGSNGNDIVYGGTGDDEVNGGYGDDYLDGGAGDDEYYGGGDDDHYFYVSGHDYMDEQSGTDILELAAGWEWGDLTFKRYDANANDLWIEINGSNSIELNNQFTSSGSWETLRLNDGTGDVNMVTMSYATYGTSGNDSINGIVYGGSTDDIIYGLAGNDTLNGYAGDDTLYGGDGDDDLRGGNDDDVLHGGAGDDDLNGATGNDTYIYTEGIDYIQDSGGTDTLLLTGGITVDDITVSDLSTYDARIVINSGTDEIDIDNLRSGSATYHIDTIAFDDGFEADLPSYNSWMTGNGTADLIASNGTGHVMLGYGGDDTLQGNGGNDTMHGGAGADTLEGGDDDDFMHGGTGDDLLYGEDGLDVLFGGSGSDTFFLEDTTAFNDIDVIKDFDVGTDDDKLDISDILDNTSYVHGTDDIADWLEITDSASNSVVKIDTTGSGTFGAGTQVATLEGITGLTDEAALVTNGTLIAA